MGNVGHVAEDEGVVFVEDRATGSVDRCGEVSVENLARMRTTQRVRTLLSKLLFSPTFRMSSFIIST